MPIYMDIEGIRIIAANNASVMGERGINYNMNNFQNNITSSYLERISNEVLVEYYVKIIIQIINSLIQTEAGVPILSKSVIEEYHKILYSLGKDNWSNLKRLVQLKLC